MPGFDVAVIGGGIIGCASAYHLARAGVRAELRLWEWGPYTQAIVKDPAREAVMVGRATPGTDFQKQIVGLWRNVEGFAMLAQEIMLLQNVSSSPMGERRAGGSARRGSPWTIGRSRRSCFSAGGGHSRSWELTPLTGSASSWTPAVGGSSEGEW
jgi:hypothetical protein